MNKLNMPFKANYYRIEPNKPKLFEVHTDEYCTCTKPPILDAPEFQGVYKLPMEPNGSFYTASFACSNPIVEFAIEPNDGTGSIKTYSVDKSKLLRKANLLMRKIHNQPLIHTIKSGNACGKLLVCKSKEINNGYLSNIKEPTIILTDNFDEIPDNPHILGMIRTSSDISLFSHFATQIRNAFDVSGCIYDPSVISRLEALDGQNIELTMKDNFISFHKTNAVSKEKTYPQITIPKLKYSDKILTSDKYNPDVIGAKAVNLRRLENLQKQGKINVEIPKSIALPWGYVDNIIQLNKKSEKNELLKALKVLKRFMDKNGIINPEIMVRSAFNGEDLTDYSAAGLYTSVRVRRSNDEHFLVNLLRAIRRVDYSKNSKTAIQSRKKYSISEDDIKTGIVIQNKINEDYKFTLYTDDNSGNIKIDLFSKKLINKEEGVQPHTFTYNKSTGELIYDSAQIGNASVVFDENMHIVDYTPIQEDLSQNPKILAQINNLCKNAMIIEKEFGAPQDIEGGFKDDNTYIWQTRNIVNY